MPKAIAKRNCTQCGYQSRVSDEPETCNPQLATLLKKDVGMSFLNMPTFTRIIPKDMLR